MKAEAPVIAKLEMCFRAIPEEGETVADLVARLERNRPDLQLMDIQEDGILLGFYSTGLTVGG